MTTKKTEGAEAMAQSQEFVSKGISNSEKIVESMIEYNAACFKGGEAIATKMYENFISNVAASFDGVKALNKTNDVTEFYKVASANMSAAAERVNDQSKSVAELTSKVLKETGEAGRLAYSKSFPLSM